VTGLESEKQRLSSEVSDAQNRLKKAEEDLRSKTDQLDKANIENVKLQKKIKSFLDG